MTLSFAASLLLSLEALGAIGTIGCGRETGCHAAAASAFGTLALVHWPLSYVGTAWFGALGAAWIATRGDFGRILLWLARLGAAASIFYVGVLAGRGYACPYCIGAHAANIGFLLLLESRPRPVVAAVKGLSPALGTAALAGLVLAFCDAQTDRSAREHSDRELQQSVAALRAASGAEPRGAPARGFTGRHRRGPADAGARIVVFTDYQCPDCSLLEAQLERALQPSAGQAPDVSLSVRHFPMCTECNRHAVDYHPNACWAARAAEAAAIVAGDDGFWRMHRWLFARAGAFTEAQLDRGLVELGFDRTQFVAAMHSDETLARIREDADLASGIGLSSTPMVLVNGVELRGFQAPDAVERALREMRAAPASDGTAADQPLTARERFLDEWRRAPITRLPLDPSPHVLAGPKARVEVVLFGDYQEPFTCEADIELRALTLGRDDVAYAFRCYPVNRACNPAAEKNLFPLACLAALGAEAAGVLQGPDGFWALHDWIITHRAEFDDGTLTKAAEELGMKSADFWQAMTRPEPQQAIAEDTLAAKEVTLTQIPLIFVAGKRVEHWKAGDESLLGVIVAEAARQ